MLFRLTVKLGLLLLYILNIKMFNKFKVMFISDKRQGFYWTAPCVDVSSGMCEGPDPTNITI